VLQEEEGFTIQHNAEDSDEEAKVLIPSSELDLL